ncbi:MAG: hypothetical protein HS111_17835 [Kofleriaceae bacterium]|nr:hypothetical protein [Kofleriaceae bacterium]MCL4224325.1 hypothetical protein [Myxococcales bacterium]
MDLHLGFAGYFAQPLALPASRARRVAALLVDPRWPWPPSWASFVKEELSKRTRARKVTGPKGRDHLLAGLTDPTNCMLEMNRSSQEVDNHAHVHAITSRRPLPAEAEYPFHMTGQTRGHELPDGASLDAWIELVHELMVACEVGHAVMPVWARASTCLSDISFMRIVVDNRWLPEVDLGPPTDFALENSRANYWRIELGGTYVRHPRWGNYLRRDHLQKIGGLDRVRAEVAPAAVVDLGDLMFIQLTATPATALTAEGEKKRRALANLMAPILPPPRPGEAQELPA